MKPKKYYGANDTIFVDKTNHIIHIKDRMGSCCTKPPFSPEKVLNSYMDRLGLYLSNDMILCEYCFRGLTFDNFRKINNFKYDDYQSLSHKNKIKLNK